MATNNPFIQAHAKRIAVLHRLKHLKNGEDAQIIFEKLDANNEPTETLPVAPFVYSAETYDGYVLPQDASDELQIPAQAISSADLVSGSSIRHGTPQGQRRFKVLQGSVKPPQGTQQFWRFHLRPVEDDEI